MKILFATNNIHKINEIRAAIGSQIEVNSLAETGIKEEIPETHDTLEGNAIEKAQYIYEHYNLACFADDTGLEVDALDGRPGVYSARYAGEGCSFEDNVNKLLLEMKDARVRTARFRTVIALVEENNCKTFIGEVKGSIAQEAFGEKGFGYDPVFVPEGYTITFAEMTLDEKNKISHRARALAKLKDYLLTRSENTK